MFYHCVPFIPTQTRTFHHQHPDNPHPHPNNPRHRPPPHKKKQAERFVERLDKLGAASGDLGLALFKVAKLEEAHGGPLAAATGTLRQAGAVVGDEKRAAAALVRAGKMLARVTGRTAREMAPLHDYLGFMPVRFFL